MLVGYARVSSKDQDLSVQIKQLTDAGCERIFQEKATGTAGTPEERPELDRCMSFVREGDVLLVTRLDRFGRSVVDFHRLIDRLDAKKVQFRCLLQPFDTTSPEGKLMRNILAAFAEFETSMRQERQREGIAKAKAAGKYVVKGGRRAPKHKLANAKQLLMKGYSYAQVAEKVKLPERTVRDNLPGFTRPYVKSHSKWGTQAQPEAQPSLPTAAEAAETETTRQEPALKHSLLSAVAEALGRRI